MWPPSFELLQFNFPARYYFGKQRLYKPQLQHKIPTTREVTNTCLKTILFCYENLYLK